MFPRQVDKKCQEETCTFKGQATGKGLWVGFCCVQWQLSVRACCLPLSLQFQNTRRRKSGYSVNQEVDTTAGRLTIPSLFYLFFCDLRNNETFFYYHVCQETQINNLRQQFDILESTLISCHELHAKINTTLTSDH